VGGAPLSKGSGRPVDEPVEVGAIVPRSGRLEDLCRSFADALVIDRWCIRVYLR
jgi:hypothetical protein